MTAESLSDEELFSEFQKGNETSFELLVKRYEKRLVGLLFKTTHQMDLAEDVFQETFIKVYQKKHLFDTSRPFRPWLFRIGINCANDHLRSKKNLPPMPDESHFETEDKNMPMPHEILSRAEIGSHIAGAVEKLPELQRQIFWMREHEKMSYQDISDALERPVNTLKSDMRRALGKLKKILAHLSPCLEG